MTLKARNDEHWLGIQLARNIGFAAVLAKVVSDCKEKIETNPAKGTPPKRLTDIFTSVNEQIHQSITLKNKISMLRNNDVVSSYQAQNRYVLCSLERSQKRALNIVTPLFEVQYESVESQFKEIVLSLNIYRDFPFQTKLMMIERDIDHLRSCLENLEQLGRSTALSEQSLKRMSKLKDDCEILSKVVASQQPGEKGHLIMRLKNFCRYPGQFSNDTQDELYAALDAMISILHDPLKEQLHHLIRAHLPDGADKDDKWCVIHRYDDIKFFKDALTMIIVKKFENEMLDLKFTPKEIYQYYPLMFEMVFGPEGKNPEQWVKSELYALLDLSEQVLQKILSQRKQNSPAKPVDLSSDELSSDELSSDEFFSSEDETDSIDEEEHDIVFGTPRIANRKQLSFATPRIVNREQLRFATPRIANREQLSNLLEKLHAIEFKAKKKSIPVNKALIQKAIVDTLSEGLRKSLYGMIFYLAPEKPHKESKKEKTDCAENIQERGWGETHCAEDIQRLYEAINVLKITAPLI